jgi:hypothetical protein
MLILDENSPYFLDNLLHLSSPDLLHTVLHHMFDRNDELFDHIMIGGDSFLFRCGLMSQLW